MTFELTDDLIDEILFFMENQDTQAVIDARKKHALSLEEADIREDEEDQRFYEIPEWNSGDGYSVMESFSNNLHNPQAKTELKGVLVSGRGVFRNFKNVLKSYPEVEKKWHLYKDSLMRRKIHQWYDELRESWGLEKLYAESTDFQRDTDDLVLSDFEFCNFNSNSHEELIIKQAEDLKSEYKELYEGDLGESLAEAALFMSKNISHDKKSGIICLNQDKDLTGSILWTSLASSKIVSITDFYVSKEFRGLGIGSHLLSAAVDQLKKSGIQHLLITNTIIPDAMFPLLLEYKFTKIGTGFMCKLN